MRSARMENASPGVDPQLWHACAGAMVQMPQPASKVCYFPQGHAEHAISPPDFPPRAHIPPFIFCSVLSIHYLADPDTDEVYARIRLQPDPQNNNNDNDVDDGALSSAALSLSPPGSPTRMVEKPASFAKTLTQSDANNGGGFSVPRYCAETIFPRLDYSTDPPVQTVNARDVHGNPWKFRHIYRGTPRRHLLTTGWSSFVNQKKLVAGDAIVFLRNGATGELCLGVRRSTKSNASGHNADWHWPPSYRTAGRWGPAGPDNLYPSSSGFARNRGKISGKSVAEAVSLAAAGQAFEVVYYPRASAPEFCVKEGLVRKAVKAQWMAGMRFKMAFETEDSSRISWFMGTVSSVQFADPVHWPNSPWRLLQVTWDEPDLLQNVKRVSPWLVEVVSSMPTIQMTPFMLPKKKLRVSQPPEFQLEGQGGIMGLQMATLTNNLLGEINSWQSLSNNIPAGMQGARHDSIYGIDFSDIHQNKIQSRVLLDNLQNQVPWPLSNGVSTELNIGSISFEKPDMQNSLSSSLNMGNSSQNEEKASRYNGCLMLFGKYIMTEQSPNSQNQQQSTGSSSDGPGLQTFNDIVSPGFTYKSLSYCNQEIERVQKLISESKNGSKVSQNSSLRSQHGENCGDAGTNFMGIFQRPRDQTASLKMNLGVKMSDDTNVHCKVFSETDEVGRTLDLTLFSNYDQLFDSLSMMFGLEGFKLSNCVHYMDIANTLRHVGEEPYGDFMKTARRLTIVSNSGRDNMSR